jgi:hypothetical protein
MSETNPNGANQYKMDPRQQLFWELYATPGGETFGNAYQSALQAGYEEVYAVQITGAPWFKEKQRRLNLLSKAEEVLQETLNVDCHVPVVGMFGVVRDKETGEVVRKVDTQILKIKQDSAKFIASTQGKDKGYSTRSELTGKDGKDLLPAPILDLRTDDIHKDDSDQKDNRDQ